MAFESGSLIYRGGRNPSLPTTAIAAPGYTGPVNAPQPGITPELAQALYDIGIGNDAAYRERVRINEAMARASTAASNIRAASAAPQTELQQQSMDSQLRSASFRALGEGSILKKPEARLRGPVALYTQQRGSEYDNAGKFKVREGKQIPYAQYQSENINAAREYLASTGGMSSWENLAPNEKRSNYEQFARKLTGAQNLPYAEIPSAYNQPNEVNPMTSGANPGTYGEFTGNTYTLQNKYIPLSVDGRSIASLPVGIQDILNKAYAGTFGAGTVPETSKLVLAGTPATMLKRAEGQMGLDQDAGHLADIAIIGQQLINQGIDPASLNDPYGTSSQWVAALADITAKKMDAQSWALWSKQNKINETIGNVIKTSNGNSGIFSWIATGVKNFVAGMSDKNATGNVAAGYLTTGAGVMTAMNAPQEYINTTYQAANFAFNGEAKNWLDGLRVAAAALVGRAIGDDASNFIGGNKLGPDGTSAAKLIAAVDTDAERQALGLHSFGENIMFDVTSVPGLFTGKNTGRYDVTIDNTPWIGILGGPITLGLTLGLNALHDSGVLKKAPGIGKIANFGVNWLTESNISAPIDVVWQVVSDPTTYTGFVAERLGASLTETGAKMAIRRGAVEEARIAASMTVGDMFAKSASEQFVDSVFVKGTQAKAFLRPASILTEEQIARFASSGRAAVMDSAAGKSWMNAVEEVVKVHGENPERMGKILKTVDSSVIEEMSLAAAQAETNATEAAMQVLRESVLNGTTRVEITLRRQVLATISTMLQSPGEGLGEEVVSKLASGRSVPIILGRSPIKPNAGWLVPKLEQMANRVGKYGRIIGQTTGQRIASVVFRLAQEEKVLVGDAAANVQQSLVDAGLSLDPEDFAYRLGRLAQIGIDTEAVPGLDKIVFALVTESTRQQMDFREFGQILSNLEVITELTINGSSEETNLLGRELLSRLAMIDGPNDPLLAGIRRVKNIGEEQIPMLKQLEEWVSVDESNLGIIKMPYTPKRVYAEALRELTRETTRLVNEKGAAGLTDSMYLLREAAVSRLANAMRVVKDWEVFRAGNVSDWHKSDSALKRELNDGLAVIKTERDALLARREYISTREVQLETLSKSDSWIMNKNGTWSSRQTVASDTKDWIDRAKLEVNDKLKTNAKARRQLTTGIKSQRDELRQNLDSILNNPFNVNWAKTAARDLDIARSNMKNLSLSKIKTLGNKGVRSVESTLADIPDPIARYAAIAGIAPTDISDPFIRGIVIANQKIANNGVIIDAKDSEMNAAWFDALRSWMDIRGEQISGMERGQKLVGRVFNINENTDVGLLGRRAVEARMNTLPSVMREYFNGRITEAIENNINDITDIAKDVERFASNPAAAQAVSMEMMKESSLIRWVEENAVGAARRTGVANNIKEKIGKFGLSFMESIAPKTIRFASHENAAISLIIRLEEMDRIAMDYQFDSVTRAELRSIAMQARDVSDLYPLVAEMQEVWSAHMNIPVSILRESQNAIWKEAKIGFLIGENGEIIKRVMTLSQRTNEVPVMSADVARRMAREYHANLTPEIAIRDGVAWTGRGTQFANEMRLKATAFAEGPIGKIAKKGHGWWKKAVVTGAPTIFVGAAAGFYYGDPSTSNDDGFGITDQKMSSALLGAMLGSLGGIRYIGRVAGIEERAIRYSLARGWSPKEWIPGLSGLKDYGVDLPMRHADQLVSSTSHPMSHISYSKLLAVTDGEWVALSKDDRFFADAWLRIINRQINPNAPGTSGGNILDRIILENFDNTDVSWRDMAEEFLNSTAGAAERRRILGGYNGPRNISEVLDGYELFVTRYLPTSEIRSIRLNANENGITREMVKEWMKADYAPASVHAERTWILPKFGDIINTFGIVYGRLIQEAPTTKMNRIPLAKSIYADEFKALRKQGVAPEIARNVAEERSYRLTNKVMFQLSDESRFASKADFFFPFQQPREELLRVYSSLVMDNQAKTLRFARLGALAFNNGVEGGIFYEDASGEYRMRIPGSAWLSRVFGAPDASFDFKVRDLFFLLQGNAFASASASPDFTLDKPMNVLLGTLPTPGGPYWSLAVSSVAQFYPDFFKDLQDNHTWIYNRMFPYGIQGSIMRPEATRLWEAFSMNTPPWEFGDPVNQQNSLDSIRNSVIDELMYENRDNPNYFDYLRTDEGQEEIRKNTSGLLLAWVAVGSVTPAPTRPIMAGSNELESVKKTLIAQFGEQQWVSKLYELRPDLASIYFTRKTQANDEGSFDRWLLTASGDKNLKAFKYTKNLSMDDYLFEMKAGQVKTKMMSELNAAYNEPTYGYNDKYAKVREIESRYSGQMKEYNFSPRNEYMARKELATIIATSNQDNYNDNINAWRQHFNVSAKDYKDWLSKSAFFRLDPYKETRTIDEILSDGVQEAINKGPAYEVSIVAQLSAAEQVKFWQWKMSMVSYYDMSESDISALVEKSGMDAVITKQYKESAATISQWNSYKTMIAKVYSSNPQLNYPSAFKVDTSIQAAQKALLEGNGAYLDMLNSKISLTTEARNNAYEAKDWNTYQSLKKQVTALYDQRSTILNDLYNKYPDLVQLQEDLKGLVFLQQNPDSSTGKFAEDQLRQRYAELGLPMLVFGREEQNFLDAPPAVRMAMKTELITRLNAPAGDFVINGIDQKMYWERLTPFQKQLLENSPLPDVLIEKWKGTTPSTGSTGGTGGIANAMLDYAKALMTQYNKRPKGASAPAAYAEYQQIPASNGTAKHAFLTTHPEVADWIRLGPLANMPELDRLQVTNIMVTYGNWSGESMDTAEITNLAWAREQLKTWSQRTGDKPSTYDIWLNMPSGVDKAEYLRQHPEVQSWIKAGPMSNMPDTYKEVVRDIMTRYGEWTASTDPLGETITAFYATPASGRQDFLDKHPELREYWRAIRTPEEQRMADLTEQYFAIPDGTARRMFISAHPELQQHFVDSRNNRYQKFLEKVAFYMGSNPSVFEEYLQTQNKILAEMIGRFGSHPLVRERSSSQITKGISIGTSGRVRNAPSRR